MLFLPARISLFGSRECVERGAFDAMNQFARLTRCGYEVVPPPSGANVIWYLQYVIGEGIAPVMIEEQPSIQACLAYGLLNSIDSHLSRFYAERTGRLEAPWHCS